MLLKRTLPTRSIRYSRRFSVTNLAKDSHIVETVNIESPTPTTVPSPQVIEIHQRDNQQKHNTLSTKSPFINKTLQFARIKTSQTTHILNNFLLGPVRSNLLVSLSLFRLIAAEQKLFPPLDTWPQAKSAYLAAFNQLRNLWLAGWFNAHNLANLAREITWGHVGRFVRVSAEMAAFYYIGELTGSLLSLPFQ